MYKSFLKKATKIIFGLVILGQFLISSNVVYAYCRPKHYKIVTNIIVYDRYKYYIPHYKRHYIYYYNHPSYYYNHPSYDYYYDNEDDYYNIYYNSYDYYSWWW